MNKAEESHPKLIQIVLFRCQPKRSNLHIVRSMKSISILVISQLAATVWSQTTYTGCHNHSNVE